MCTSRWRFLNPGLLSLPNRVRSQDCDSREDCSVRPRRMSWRHVQLRGPHWIGMVEHRARIEGPRTCRVEAVRGFSCILGTIPLLGC
jgi:hypothetical protein